MHKSKIKTFLSGFFTIYGVIMFFQNMYNLFIWKASDKELFWESHPFEDTLEKADDFCEIGFTFQRNEIIYKKISEKKWFAEILIPDDNEFEIGCELTIENYICKKIGEKVWTIERRD